MERAELLVHLEAAKRHAEQGRIYIARQKQGITALTAAGANTSDAERVLQVLEEIQNGRLSDVQRLLNQLDDQPHNHPRSGFRPI
jgi:hypothetical protein